MSALRRAVAVVAFALALVPSLAQALQFQFTFGSFGFPGQASYSGSGYLTANSIAGSPYTYNVVDATGTIFSSFSPASPVTVTEGLGSFSLSTGGPAFISLNNTFNLLFSFAVASPEAGVGTGFLVGPTPGQAVVGIAKVPGQVAAVPGPIAGAGLPVLALAGAVMWYRRRKATPTLAA